MLNLENLKISETPQDMLLKIANELKMENIKNPSFSFLVIGSDSKESDDSTTFRGFFDSFTEAEKSINEKNNADEILSIYFFASNTYVTDMVKIKTYL